MLFMSLSQMVFKNVLYKNIKELSTNAFQVYVGAIDNKLVFLHIHIAHCHLQVGVDYMNVLSNWWVAFDDLLPDFRPIVTGVGATMISGLRDGQLKD